MNNNNNIKITELADEYISTLKNKTYGEYASNTLEGDFGSWNDWRDALVEFATNISKNTKTLCIKDNVRTNMKKYYAGEDDGFVEGMIIGMRLCADEETIE